MWRYPPSFVGFGLHLLEIRHLKDCSRAFLGASGQTGCSQKARNQSFKWWISIKWSLNSMKLEGYLHIYPVNISPRDLSQKIRGTREFEERSKRIGVFSRTWKTLIRGTRESWEFSPGLDGQETNHGVPKPSKRKLRSQKPPKERKSSHEQEMNGNTQELLKGDLDFIQIHRDLQRTSPIQELDLHPFIHPLKFVDLAII